MFPWQMQQIHTILWCGSIQLPSYIHTIHSLLYTSHIHIYKQLKYVEIDMIVYMTTSTINTHTYIHTFNVSIFIDMSYRCTWNILYFASYPLHIMHIYIVNYYIVILTLCWTCMWSGQEIIIIFHKEQDPKTNESKEIQWEK